MTFCWKSEAPSFCSSNSSNPAWEPPPAETPEEESAIRAAPTCAFSTATVVPFARSS